jgi:cell division protein ZapE
MSIRDKFSSYKNIEPDQYQRDIVDTFDNFQQTIINERKIVCKVISFLQGSHSSSKGIYLWGNVGRGKTFLMDLFYETLSITEKDRRHFHRLMEEIHGGIKRFKDHQDPINKVAESMSKKYRILCIDEFYVEDIADATIMARLIESLLHHDIKLVMTSNCIPDDLYKNGLQRDLFIPALNKIKENLHVIHIGNGQDFRRSSANKDIEHISIHDDKSMVRLAKYLGFYDNELKTKKSVISIRNREIECIVKTNQLVWFEFDAICGKQRSVKDYIDISDQFETVVITGVPIFTSTSENEARRFIALIDELYDQNINLFMTVFGHYQDLYQGNKLRSEFTRTTSRLIEMSKKD